MRTENEEKMRQWKRKEKVLRKVMREKKRKK